MPKISKKQKESIELALKEGYYEYPRKIELKDLAKGFVIYDKATY